VDNGDKKKSAVKTQRKRKFDLVEEKGGFSFCTFESNCGLFTFLGYGFLAGKSGS
jgi:hypothetical protein